MKNNLQNKPKISDPNYNFERKPIVSDPTKLAILKSTREAKGLSLENVHEATKIPMDVLRAIEEGYSVRSFSPFYYKGFIKIYASYLEINVSEILEALPKQTVRPVAAEPIKESFDFASAVDQFLTPERKKQIMMGLSIIVALFLVVKVFGFIKTKWTAFQAAHPKSKSEAVLYQNKEKNSAKKKETGKVTTKEDVKEHESVAPQKPATALEQKAVSSTQETSTGAVKEISAAAMKNVTLTARAKKDCWLLVKSDDQVIFQSTLSTGSVETWLAKDKIEISGRNLSQLEFELNGKMIGPLGRQDRQAKKIFFTKDGLSVSK